MIACAREVGGRRDHRRRAGLTAGGHRAWGSCGWTIRAGWWASWRSRRPSRSWTCVRTDPAWIDARGIRQPRTRLPGQHGHLPVQPQDAGRRAGEDRLPRLRQGGLSRLDPLAPRAGPPVRRLLGGHRHDQVVLPGQPGPGGGQSALLAVVGRAAPIYSPARFLPPSRIDGATVRGSLVADGCVSTRGRSIENSVIGLRCRIGRNVLIRNSILMGNDFYESPDDGPRQPGDAVRWASATAAGSTARSSTRTAASAATCGSTTPRESNPPRRPPTA